MTKILITVTGSPTSSTDPTTGFTYAEANAPKFGDGIGFVLGDGIGCIDLDHVLDDAGRLNDEAARYLATLPDTYAEVSPSGHGLHVWGPLLEQPGRVQPHGACPSKPNQPADTSPSPEECGRAAARGSPPFFPESGIARCFDELSCM